MFMTRTKQIKINFNKLYKLKINSHKKMIKQIIQNILNKQKLHLIMEDNGNI